MPRPQLPTRNFASREDAAWLLLGFVVFAVAWALAVVTLRESSGTVRIGVVAPLAILLIVGAAILEIALRRLQAHLTGRALSPWPFGLVSMTTVAVALAPSTIAEAAGRIGVNGRVVAGLIYGILIADLIALTVLVL